MPIMPVRPAKQTPEEEKRQAAELARVPIGSRVRVRWGGGIGTVREHQTEWSATKWTAAIPFKGHAKALVDWGNGPGSFREWYSTSDLYRVTT